MRKDAMRIALSLAAVIVSATGCATSPPPTGERPSVSPMHALPDVSAAGSVIALPTGGVPLRQISSQEAAKLTTVAWSQVTIDSSGTLLTVVVDNVGGCRHLEGSYVEQEPSSITIAVLVARAPQKAECAAVDRTAIATIKLPAPLGQRKLLHAPATG